jgi:hypothetical protein
VNQSKGKAIAVWAYSGPESSSKLWLLGGKVVSHMHGPPLAPRRYPWHSFLLESESAPKDDVNENEISLVLISVRG